jgi:hypothetical protein
MYPFLACVDDWDDRATTKCKAVLEAQKSGDTRNLDYDDIVVEAALEFPDELLALFG